MNESSSSSFHDVVAQFHTLSEQLKTTTTAAERQDLLRQFRILLDQADRISVQNHSMAKSFGRE